MTVQHYHVCGVVPVVMVVCVQVLWSTVLKYCMDIHLLDANIRGIGCDKPLEVQVPNQIEYFIIHH